MLENKCLSIYTLIIFSLMFIFACILCIKMLMFTFLEGKGDKKIYMLCVMKI